MNSKCAAGKKEAQCTQHRFTARSGGCALRVQQNKQPLHPLSMLVFHGFVDVST